MKRRLTPWLLVLTVLSVPGLGELGAVPRAVAADVPFTGVVVQDQVVVRAGAGRKYYAVGKVKQGTKVTVEQVIFGWNEILPPKGVYSYISQAYVDAKGDGTTGVVNADDAKVTAGNLQGPGLSYRQQKSLDKGAKVAILGREGSFYKIAPPQGAYVFLPPGAVRRAAMEQVKPVEKPVVKPAPSTPQQKAPAPTNVSPNAGEVSKPKEGASEAGGGSNEPAKGSGQSERVMPAKPRNQPAVGEPQTSETPKTQPTSPTKPAPKPKPTPEKKVAATQPEKAQEAKKVVKVETPAVSAALRQVEMKELPLFSQPVVQQPLAKMQAAYEAVAGRANLPALDRRIIRIRLAMIKRNQKLAQTLSEINQVQQQVDQAEAAEKAKEAAAKAHPTPVNYDLVGRLEASSVYDGQNLPRLFRVVDHNGDTLAYVSPSQVDAHRMLGELVGVVGSRQYNSALKLDVFQIKRIDLLDAKP